jgi:hypothetical protein
MTVQPTITPARAARRQILSDRIAEYLTDRCGSPDRAAAYATDIRDIVEQLGWTLPAALDDPPPPRPANASTDGPGYAAWLAARAELAARHTRATP